MGTDLRVDSHAGAVQGGRPGDVVASAATDSVAAQGSTAGVDAVLAGEPAAAAVPASAAKTRAAAVDRPPLAQMPRTAKNPAAAAPVPAEALRPFGRRRLRRNAEPTRARTARLHRVLPSSMFTRELLLTLARPRSVVVKLAMPLILTVPLVAGGAPTFWAGMLLTVLVAMVGAVGSGVTLARARSGGLLARLAVVPRPPAQVVGTWVLAAAVVDTAQMLPVALVVFATGTSPLAAAALLAAVPAVVLLTNTVGCLLSLLADGPGEVLLDVVVVLAPLLFLGGLFTGVPRDGWRFVAARVDPFAYLHSAFTGALGGTPTFSATDTLIAAALTAAASLAALAAVSRAILRRT